MRCFLAIELPDPIRDALTRLQERLDAHSRGVRWTRPEQIHLTMKFFGEVPDDDVAHVADVAAQATATCQPFDLTIAGAGCFPPGGAARIVWAGIPDPPAELLTCHRTCEEAFAKIGYEPERRQFNPHLTIGRVRDPKASRAIRAAVEQESAFTAGDLPVEELILFQSILRPQGPTYTPVAHIRLSG